MKKIILSFVCILIATTVFADNDKPISVDQLPANSQTFIKTHFPDSKVSYAKMEKEIFDKSYEIVFVDGSKVEFDKKGEWKDVDCKHTQVPVKIIPAKVLTYITANYQGVAVIEIDRDSRDYEVKLNNGLELKFDMKFNIIGIDD